MKIAIISDIHENFHNLALFYEQAKKIGIEQILCLGDLMNGGVAMVLAKSSIPTFMVRGNNDGDKVFITRYSCQKGSNLTVGFETFDIINIDNREIFLTHYPILAKPMAESGNFDAVFYGHNHTQNIDKIGDCVIANPGKLGSSNGAFVLYDTKTNKIKIIQLEGCISLDSNKTIEYMKKIGFKRPKDKSREYGYSACEIKII